MRKKVKRILALLLAIGLAVSVMSGMALSASSEEGADPASSVTEEVVQEEPVDTTPEEPADEPAAEEEEQEEQDVPEEADPEPAAEEEEQGEPASAGEAFDQTMTVGSGDKTVKVRTTAEAGVLPEGAALVVKQFEDTDSQYQEAADQLDANEIAYDGLLALDVGFEADGQEVEPNGSVDVQFELGAGLLPEDADADTLAVQHLTDAGKVETVADVGSVAVQNEKINADFTVDSFSTFTITYHGNNITVHRVDNTGKELTAGSTVDKEGYTTWTAVSTYADEIDGYEYVGAHVGSYTGTTITKIRYNKDKGWQYQTGSAQTGKFNGQEIYLVYNKTSSYTDPNYTTNDIWALETYGETCNFKVYRLYENAVPADINKEFDTELFGPKGNNEPYFTVTVNLAKLLKLSNMNVTQTNGHMYISLSSCATDGVNMDIDTFWNKEFWLCLKTHSNGWVPSCWHWPWPCL